MFLRISDLKKYYNESEPLIRNLNFSVKKGEIVSFIGESGSGKTTFSDLILNFHELKNGVILINDIDIKNININSLRDKIGLQFGPGIGSTEIKFTSYLQSEHNIKVKIVPPEEDEKSVKKFDEKNNTLILSEMLTYTARNFHLAYQIGYCECKKII